VGDLWLPPDASTDGFVARVYEQVRRFAEREQVMQAIVEVELREGGVYKLDRLAPEPGHGFVTLRPHAEDDGEREELIVPLPSIARIRIVAAEAEPRFGFGLPETPASA
jgi:hypothetical protein